MDRRTRKLLTIGGLHHPKADVEKLYIKRLEDGRGLIELESAYESSIVRPSDYIQQSKDRFNRLVKEHDAGKGKYSPQKKAEKIKKKYLRQEA